MNQSIEINKNGPGFTVTGDCKAGDSVNIGGSIWKYWEKVNSKNTPWKERKDNIQLKPHKCTTQHTALPHRRQGYTQKFKVNEITVYLHTGEYLDGTLGEIFIDLDKTGSTLRATMNSFAIMVSMALQHGVPLDKIADKFLHTKFEPSGMVQCSTSIKQCSSIIDLIFKELAITYLGRKELKNG